MNGYFLGADSRLRGYHEIDIDSRNPDQGFLILNALIETINMAYRDYCKRGDVITLTYDEFVTEYILNMNKLVFTKMIDSGDYNCIYKDDRFGRL